MRLIDADDLIDVMRFALVEDEGEQVIDFDNLKAYIDEQPTIPTYGQWISVKDRLPKVNEEVLAIFNGRFHKKIIVTRMFKHDDGDYYWEYIAGGLDYPINDITHWMPLPKPPKGGC